MTIAERLLAFIDTQPDTGLTQSELERLLPVCKRWRWEVYGHRFHGVFGESVLNLCAPKSVIALAQVALDELAEAWGLPCGPPSVEGAVASIGHLDFWFECNSSGSTVIFLTSGYTAPFLIGAGRHPALALGRMLASWWVSGVPSLPSHSPSPLEH